MRSSPFILHPSPFSFLPAPYFFFGETSTPTFSCFWDVFSQTEHSQWQRKHPHWLWVGQGSPRHWCHWFTNNVTSAWGGTTGLPQVQRSCFPTVPRAPQGLLWPIHPSLYSPKCVGLPLWAQGGEAGPSILQMGQQELFCFRKSWFKRHLVAWPSHLSFACHPRVQGAGCRAVKHGAQGLWGNWRFLPLAEDGMWFQ